MTGIAVLAPANQPTTRDLMNVLETLSPGNVPLADIAVPADQSVALDATGVRWAGVDLSDRARVLVTGYRYADPVVPGAHDDVDWAQWQARYLAEQQKASFLMSVLARLVGHGVDVWNGLNAHILSFMRPTALARAQRAGMALPPMLTTNNPNAADRFIAAHPSVLWRPPTGRAPWQLFGPRQRKHLIAADKPPILLAAGVIGQLERVFVVGGRVVLSLSRYFAVHDELERLDRWQVAALGPHHRAVEAAAAALGIGWGAFDIVVSDGRAVLYDIDPDPIVDDLPGSVREELISALAHGLLGRPVDPAAVIGRLPSHPMERPTMFLRRMMQLQFEMEATKHEPLD